MKALDALKMCLNPKVIGGLALVAGLVFVFDPHLLLAVLPLLLLAACPLSILLMGGVMMGGHHESGQATPPASSESAGEIARLRSEVETLRDQVAANNAAATSAEVKASS